MHVMWMIAAVLAGIGVALFVAPHHRGYQSAASLAQDFQELLSEGQIESPGALMMAALAVIGCLGVFLPALLAAMIPLMPERTTRGVLIAGGVVLLIASALTFFVEIVSNMLIGFGSGSKYPITTLVAYLAPLFPFLCGMAAILMGTGRIRIR
jgi:hypothetical protein